ncbi:MAG: hypothetical protein ABJF50_20680 [Paracoccaceae bacterium]
MLALFCASLVLALGLACIPIFLIPATSFGRMAIRYLSIGSSMGLVFVSGFTFGPELPPLLAKALLLAYFFVGFVVVIIINRKTRHLDEE